jgi:hypothetical protein
MQHYNKRMDLEGLREIAPGPVRRRLLSQCLERLLGRPSRVVCAPSRELSGVVTSFTACELVLATSDRQELIPLANVVYFEAEYARPQLRTDADISRNLKTNRKLEQWKQDGPEVALESEDRNWCQFKTNEAKFGVVSTYDEELYTTKKVPESHLSKAQIKRALKIEKEINSRGSKEREEVEEEDEEKMFGAVLGTGRYLEVIAPQRERATSMASCMECFSRDEYKKTREMLINPRKARADSIGINIASLGALALEVAHPLTDDPKNGDVLLEFKKFKEEKLPSRYSLLKEFADFSRQMNEKTMKLEVIHEEDMKMAPKSVVNLFIVSWRGLQEQTLKMS